MKNEIGSVEITGTEARRIVSARNEEIADEQREQILALREEIAELKRDNARLKKELLSFRDGYEGA